MKDVARRAGVSVMTVSNVINGRSSKVGESTRRKVEEAMAKLSYRLDPAGRSLRLSRRFLVEMVIVDPSPTFVADAFSTSVLAGLSNCLNQRDYGLILRGTSGERLLDSGALRSRQTDALCVMASGPPVQREKIYRHLASLGDPLLIFQDKVPASITDAVSLMQDDLGGGTLLARHLLELGCRRFVWVSQKHRWPALEKREAGIQKVLKSAGARTSLRSLATEGGDYVSTQRAIATHVATEGTPDAFLCSNDQTGIAVVNWLIDNGYRVPEDVRVTGFNAFDFWRYSRPMLTTVESPAYELGELGGRMILDRLHAGRFETRGTVLPVKLRVGAS